MAIAIVIAVSRRGDIVNHEFRLAAGRADRFGGGLAGGFVDIAEDDGRAFSRQDLRVREPRGRGRTGNDGDFFPTRLISFASLGFEYARPWQKASRKLLVNVSGFNHL
ncbi:MAG: hypothetical protein PVG76_04655 [Chromatiales bacterium]|jgi:hypothetical protein